MYFLVNIIIFCIIGIILGTIWFIFMERSNKTKFMSENMECWEKLHYIDKERAPLWLVHLKSFAAGLALVIVAMTNFKYKNSVIGFIGGGIIGVHLCQVINEMDIIN